MIRLMESAGSRALQPFCEPGEISVGTAVHVEHRVPAGINALIKAEATVESVEGRFINIHVVAKDGKTEVGRGTIQRVIVRTDDFLKKHDIQKQ